MTPAEELRAAVPRSPEAAAEWLLERNEQRRARLLAARARQRLAAALGSQP